MPIPLTEKPTFYRNIRCRLDAEDKLKEVGAPWPLLSYWSVIPGYVGYFGNVVEAQRGATLHFFVEPYREAAYWNSTMEVLCVFAEPRAWAPEFYDPITQPLQ